MRHQCWTHLRMISPLKYLHICRLEGLLGGNCRGGAVSRGGDNKGRSEASDSLAQPRYTYCITIKIFHCLRRSIIITFARITATVSVSGSVDVMIVLCGMSVV